MEADELGLIFPPLSAAVCLGAKCQNAFTHTHMLREAYHSVHTLLTCFISDVSIIFVCMCVEACLQCGH